MGYYATSELRRKGDVHPENRVWEFFCDAQKSRLENRCNPLKTSQGNAHSPTKTASGRTYWPSRDPIGERGGFNLYGMVSNAALSRVDILGMIGEKCSGRCGAIIDDWIVDEIQQVGDGFKAAWENYHKNIGTGDTKLAYFLDWVYPNTEYKNSNKFVFNQGTSCGKSDESAAPGLGCGRTVTLCGKCLKTSTLGNIMFGYLAQQEGLFRDAVSEVKLLKRAGSLIGAVYDPYDGIAYKVGAAIVLGGYDPWQYKPKPVPGEPSFEEPTNEESREFMKQNFCQSFNSALSGNEGALRTVRPNPDNFADLSSCKPCKEKSTINVHGGGFGRGVNIGGAIGIGN